MVALDFPNSPTVGQKYHPITGGPSWTWNGYAWQTGGPMPALGPVITSIDPASGVPGATVDVTIYGSNFGSDSIVHYNGSTALVLSQTRLSDTQIQASFNLATAVDGQAVPITVLSNGLDSPQYLFQIVNV